MKEIRIHARAGQGAITTAALLGHAYFLKGIYAYAFPNFGAARMGAPMNAFVSQIYEPDYVIVVDATLLRGFNCFSGLKDNGIAIINQRQGIDIPKIKPTQKVYLVPANDIALKTIGRPLGNTALLGAYAAATDEFDLEALIGAISKRFSEKAKEANIEAVKLGYEYVRTTYSKTR
ncbi:MAG: 2-oxoacid:acceptor oxidoreductase family protein [Candidatus Omnitrophica bacterium]|nr:2-oxoacid:acceptor oxidoreductase family protein [Candidatus Omnitrophota bacterium]